MNPKPLPSTDDDPFAQIEDAAVEAAIESFEQARLRPCSLSNDLAPVAGMGPLFLAHRWQQRIERGDDYAREVGRAAEIWQAEQDAKRDLRKLNYQYKEALSRGDSETARRISREIFKTREALRTARSQS